MRTPLLKMVTGLLTAAVLSAAPAVAAPPTPTVDGAPTDTVVDLRPGALKPGHRPRTTYMVGRTIHPKTGDPIVLDVPRARWEGLRLLGRGDRGWVVQSSGDPFLVYNVSARGTAKPFLTLSSYDGDAEWRLSRDGSRVLSWADDRGGFSSVTVYGVNGRRLGGRSFGSLGHVLDFAGPRLLATVDRTIWWWPESRPTLVTPRSSRMAAPGRDTLFVVRDDGRVGPTKLSAPGTPRWTARFDAIRISPDGRYVLGRRQDGEAWPINVLEVRRLTDGHLVRAFRLGDDDWLRRSTIWWESARAFLFRVETSRGRTVVRCWVGGTCNRATRWVQDTDFSIPFENPQYGD